MSKFIKKQGLLLLLYIDRNAVEQIALKKLKL